MRKLLSKLLINCLLLSAILTPGIANAAQAKPSEDNEFNKQISDFIFQERKLWLEHVLWTRNFIISDLDGLEDKQNVLDRLLKNQEDIGASIKPYFGNETGDKLTALLKQHVLIGGQVVDAVKAGNKSDIDKYSKLWYANADELTNFLSKINAEWNKKELKDLLYKHLQLTTEQVLARKSKDWSANIASFDVGEDHILKLADTLSEGIIKKFPDKFK